MIRIIRKCKESTNPRYVLFWLPNNHQSNKPFLITGNSDGASEKEESQGDNEKAYKQ